MKIANDPDARTVRFLVCAAAGFHAPIAARLAATYPDVKLIPLDTNESDPLGLAGIPSPSQTLRARLRGEPTAPLGVEVLRLKKARRWLWALATTKDYEHAPIESLVSVMHATRVRCVVELVLTPAPVLLDRYAGRALRGRERSFKLEGGFSPQEPGVQSVVAQKHLKGALEGVGRALWWFDYRILVPAEAQAAGRHIAGVVQETRGGELSARQGHARAARVVCVALGSRPATAVPGVVERGALQRGARVAVASADVAIEGRSAAPHRRAGGDGGERDQP